MNRKSWVAQQKWVTTLRDLVSLSWWQRNGRKVWSWTETRRVPQVQNFRAIHPIQRNNIENIAGARVPNVKPREVGKRPRVSEGSLWSTASVNGPHGPKFGGSM